MAIASTYLRFKIEINGLDCSLGGISMPKHLLFGIINGINAATMPHKGTSNIMTVGITDITSPFRRRYFANTSDCIKHSRKTEILQKAESGLKYGLKRAFASIFAIFTPLNGHIRESSIQLPWHIR